MSKPTYAELEAKHRETMVKLAGSQTPIMLELDALHAMTLIGLLQLTTRHPALPAASRAYAHALADQLAGAVIAIAPSAAEVVALGWDPKFDQP